MWREAITALWLIVMSICDIRKKSVPVALLYGGAMFAGMVLIYQGVLGSFSPLELCKALLPGVFLLVLAKATEKAGCADGIVLMLLGVIEGSTPCLMILLGGLVLAALVSGVLLTAKKAGRNTKLPFVPFLTAGWVLALCGKWGVL